MATGMMIDNWTLQDLGTCLVDGLDEDTTSELAIDVLHDSHSYRDVCRSGVQLEALIGLLTDIVLRDAILVDQKFSGTWARYGGVFDAVTGPGLLRPVDFLVRGDELRGPTKAIVDSLCVTATLRDAQRENEQSWEKIGKVVNRYDSQVLWGTAGMLSRSHVFEVPYYGHPLRRRVLEQTLGPTRVKDAVKEIVDWMVSERLRVYEGQVRDVAVRRTLIVLPMVVVDVINEANDVSQLISVAVEIREKYRKLREWLRVVQTVMDSEDVKGIMKYKRTLTAVGRDIDRALGKGVNANLSVSVAMSGFGTSLKILNMENVLKKFGIRAVLNKQILASQGEVALKKLLRLFGEEKTALGLRSLDYLRSLGVRAG